MGRWAQGNAELARIGRLEKDRNVAGLIAELGNDADYGRYTIIRSHAATALGRLGDLRAVPHLAELAQDSEPVARHSAVRALGKLKAKDATQVIVSCLRDPEPMVRAAAAKSLGKLESTTVVPELYAVLDTDPHADVRLVAAQALVDLGDVPVRSRLDQALRDVSWRVRHHPDRKRLRRLADAYARRMEGP